jgi:hypothetical protein
MSDPLAQALLLRERVAEKQIRFEQIKVESHNLDTVINFKVNSLVKSEFEQICKDSHSSVSRELKLFMLDVIKSGKLR